MFTQKLRSEIAANGTDILSSAGMRRERLFLQHGRTSVFDHSLNVAYCSLYLADLMHLPIDRRALIRGALLHDYFLYDWHKPSPEHRFHGFIHATIAARNAEKDFVLGDIERDIILKHMFPLNFHAPRCRESLLVCLADKLCAVAETIRPLMPRRAVRR